MTPQPGPAFCISKMQHHDIERRVRGLLDGLCVPALLTARTACGARTHARTRQLARSHPPCTGRPIP